MLALTLPHVQAGGEPAPEGRPLGFPQELWAEMSEEYRSACTSAAALLDTFGEKRTASLRSMSRRAGLEFSDALAGLRVLDGMNLVDVESGDRGPVITLLAVPEDHVRIVGPDGGIRWVFVARPLDPPELPPEALN
jgi:hypothetical protein